MRPILRYYGGKWLSADWIISHFPKHKIYVEPYGGAASVLLKKPRSYAEVYNDIDGEIVNLFRMARDSGNELMEKIKLTPFARDEHTAAYLPTEDPMEWARRTILKSFLGFGSDSIYRKSGFRANCNRSGTTPAQDWKNLPIFFKEIIDRLRGVVIENKDALSLIDIYDKFDTTLFYVDPPYLHNTRTGGERYRFEMTGKDHVKLLKVLRKCKSKIIVSGYESPIYNKYLKKWRKDKKKTLAQYALSSANSERWEILWMNFKKTNSLF